MLIRVLKTRRASRDGMHTETFLRGRVYDLPDEFVRRAFPDGSYEAEVKAVSGHSENKALGADDAPAPADGRKRWRWRNKGK